LRISFGNAFSVIHIHDDTMLSVLTNNIYNIYIQMEKKDNFPSSLYPESRRQRQRMVELERSDEQIRRWRQKQRNQAKNWNLDNQPKGCFGKFCDTIKRITGRNGGRKTKHLRNKYKKTRNIKKDKSKRMIV